VRVVHVDNPLVKLQDAVFMTVATVAAQAGAQVGDNALSIFLPLFPDIVERDGWLPTGRIVARGMVPELGRAWYDLADSLYLVDLYEYLVEDDPPDSSPADGQGSCGSPGTSQNGSDSAKSRYYDQPLRLGAMGRLSDQAAEVERELRWALR
jgi:hypothetical protein